MNKCSVAGVIGRSADRQTYAQGGAAPEYACVENLEDRRSPVEPAYREPQLDADVRCASWSLPPDASSVAWARHLIRARLASWALDGPSEVAQLLVSELVTNAVRHARGPYRLVLYVVEDLLRCEVQDADEILPQLRHVDAGDENGRGLAVLDLLACCWGSQRTLEGKSVWFELPVVAPVAC
ncbi:MULTISPECIES: ATP-binding protein [Nonomuraea]|uniref:ATP-binding protein n=1 Tax=Nonomuraea mangrovi TaxID=2316207 RepID=A0ABW4SWW6_9ACTN